MAEFPNDQARASYSAGLRDERAGLKADLSAARAAKETGRISALTARLRAVDDEIERVTGDAQVSGGSESVEPPAGKDAAGEKKDGGGQ